MFVLSVDIYSLSELNPGIRAGIDGSYSLCFGAGGFDGKVHFLQLGLIARSLRPGREVSFITTDSGIGELGCSSL